MIKTLAGLGMLGAAIGGKSPFCLSAKDRALRKALGRHINNALRMVLTEDATLCDDIWAELSDAESVMRAMKKSRCVVTSRKIDQIADLAKEFCPT